MKVVQYGWRTIMAAALAVLALAPVANVAARPSVEAPRVIRLTQTGCQFVEPEGKDFGYTTRSNRDCQRINAETARGRLSGSRTLTLKPGKYIFRVTNKNVPYELGFYLRGSGLLNRLRLPKVAGGGIRRGETQDFEIDLSEGVYAYSCPLNPTPNHRLVVKG